MNKNILKWVIYIGLFLIPFVPFLVYSSLFFPFITSKAFTFRIIVEIIFGAWLILVALAPEFRPRKSIILYSLLAFVFIIGLADVFGVAPVKSFWSNYERMEGFITILHLGALFLVIGSVFKEREWKWWWNTSLIASALMILYGLLQLMGLAEIHQSGVRLDGTIGNAAYLAVYMLFHIFLALMFFLRENKNTFLKWTYGVLIFGQVFILYYTATRGAILGLLGGLLIVAILNLRNKENRGIQKTSLIGIVLFVVLVSGFWLSRDTAFIKSSPVLSRFSNISLAEIKTEGRSFVWPIALEGIKERPILGWGQDNFNYVFNEHYDPKMYRLEPWFDRAHNIFLDWAIAGGLLGLFAYLFLYAALLISLWKKSDELSYVDRSILTGLLAGYFFHNFFVFDHLISYILFASVLAYVHARSHKQSEWGVALSPEKTFYFLAPVVVVALGFGLYFINIKAINANSELIFGLQFSQSVETKALEATNAFRNAYYESRLGRPEVVEWIVSSAPSILGGNLSVEEKNNYFAFAKGVAEKQAEDFKDDARYQLLAGSFFSRTGNFDDAITYLKRAQELIPGKQQVYIELGSAYLNKGDAATALTNFKKAYEMAPENMDAKIIYLIGAIYAGDIVLADELTRGIPEEILVTDSRLASVLAETKNYGALVKLLERRLILNPNDPNKVQLEKYIRDIQNGTIK
ncbi:MAG: O-antigen ligase family protein [Minisyncoccota bacterium]